MSIIDIAKERYLIGKEMEPTFARHEKEAYQEAARKDFEKKSKDILGVKLRPVEFNGNYPYTIVDGYFIFSNPRFADKVLYASKTNNFSFNGVYMFSNYLELGQVITFLEQN